MFVDKSKSKILIICESGGLGGGRVDVCVCVSRYPIWLTLCIDATNIATILITEIIIIITFYL
jgi:hypothetical protein